MIKGAMVLLALTAAGATVTHAQSLERTVHKEADEWTAKTGIYVPKSVREAGINFIKSHPAASVTSTMAGRPPNLQTTTTDQVFWLERYPTIRVIVQPTPPKGFQLTINGEVCPATEKAMYRVPVGAVTVRVWRQGTSVCERKYTTAEGSTYDVQCAF